MSNNHLSMKSVATKTKCVDEKELYGMKQPLRVWYMRLCRFNKNGFNKISSEPTLDTKVKQQKYILIICVYVNDLIFTRNLSIIEFKTTMKTQVILQF